MVVESSAGEAEVAALALWDLGATAIEERAEPSGSDVVLVAGFPDLPSAIAALSAVGDRWTVGREEISDDSWRHKWKRTLRPIPVGDRFLIVPESRSPHCPDQSGPGGRIAVRIDPGDAFGAGTHESTRMALALLERTVRRGDAVLDVGCGTGILAIGAALLGATGVVAIDVDGAAVTVTRDNAVRNIVGSRVRASTDPLADVGGSFDVVAANLPAGTMQDVLPDLLGHVRPGGSLVLSGLLEEQSDEVVAALGDAPVTDTACEGGWLALTAHVASLRP